MSLPTALGSLPLLCQRSIPAAHPLDLHLNAKLRLLPRGQGLLHQRLSRQELAIGRDGFLTEGAVAKAPGEFLAGGAVFTPTRTQPWL